MSRATYIVSYKVLMLGALRYLVKTPRFSVVPLFGQTIYILYKLKSFIRLLVIIASCYSLVLGSLRSDSVPFFLRFFLLVGVDANTSPTFFIFFQAAVIIGRLAQRSLPLPLPLLRLALEDILVDREDQLKRVVDRRVKRYRVQSTSLLNRRRTLRQTVLHYLVRVSSCIEVE